MLLALGCTPILAKRATVAPWRLSELAPILTAELRRAVIADGESDLCDIYRLRHEPRTRRLKPKLLLVLDRRHGGDAPEVPMEGRNCWFTQ